MTLNSRYALYYRKDAAFRAHHKIWMKIDPSICRKNVGHDSSFWRYKIYANIRGGSPGRGRQTTVVLSTTAIFSVFVSCLLGNYRWGQHHYIAIRSPSWAFQASENAWPWMTLNSYFALNSVFAPVWLVPTVRISKNNCVKTNKGRHILCCQRRLRRKSSTGTLVSGNIRFVQIFPLVL